MNFCVAQTGAGGVTQRLSVVRVQQNFLESLYTSMAATLPAYFSCMHVLSLVRRERRRSFQHNAWLGRLVVNTTFLLELYRCRTEPRGLLSEGGCKDIVPIPPL